MPCHRRVFSWPRLGAVTHTSGLSRTSPAQNASHLSAVCAICSLYCSSMWSSSATFTFDFTYQYKDYTTEDTDYFFASSTYYMPYSTSSGTTVPVAEIKPYTPLIYEFVVQKPES